MTRFRPLFLVCTLLLVPQFVQAHSEMDLGAHAELPPFIIANTTRNVGILVNNAAFDPAVAVVVTVESNAELLGTSNTSPRWRCSGTKPVRCIADTLEPGHHLFNVSLRVPNDGTVTVTTLIESIASEDPDFSNNRAVRTSRVYAQTACSINEPALLSVSPVAASTELVWSAASNASHYEVYASVDGETPHVVATTSATRALVRLPGGGAVNWFVRAHFEGCPSQDSGTRSVTSLNAPARLSVSSIVSPMFVEPVAVTFDLNAVLIADAGAKKILSHFVGSDSVFNEDVSGDVVVTPLSADGGITVGPGRYLYIADRTNDLVRYAFPYRPRPVLTLAGMPNAAGSTDAAGTAARVNAPTGVSVSPYFGKVYIADSGNHTIREAYFDPAKGEFGVTTFAGAAGQAGASNGQRTAARFNDPAGLVYGSITDLVVADRGNHTIRRITQSGDVKTIAGVAGQSGHRDGDAAQALFNRPTGVAFDAWGNVLVSEEGNHTIRKIAPNGRVTTIAGTPGVAGAADGIGSAALFNRPGLLAIDADGTIWIPDAGNGKLRRAEYVMPAPKRRSARN